MPALDFTAQEASRRENWMIPCLSKCLATGELSKVVTQVEGCFEVFEKALSGVSSQRGNNLRFPRAISAVVNSHPLSGVIWAHWGWTSGWKQEREATSVALKFILWHFNSIFWLLLFWPAVFFPTETRGGEWMEKKEAILSEGLFFEAKLLMYAFLTSCAICFSKSAGANWLSVAYYWFKPITSDFCLGKNEIVQVFLPKASWVEKMSDRHEAH